MSLAIVQMAKTELIASGQDLSGNDGAFKITMEAASRIPGAGVVDKPNGNHATFNGASYSVDGLMFKDGRFFDCLIDGGGKNEPCWNQGDNIDPARWRAPVAILHQTPAVVIPDAFEIGLDNLYLHYHGVLPTAAELAAHRLNPGGLAAIEALLEAEQERPPQPEQPNKLATLEQSVADMSTQMAALSAQIAAMQYAYVKFNTKPEAGGVMGYIKFGFKPLA